MPWHIEKDSGACSTGEPWAVIKDSDGSVAGCHSTEEEAKAQLAALYANEEGDSMSTDTVRTTAEWETRITELRAAVENRPSRVTARIDYRTEPEAEDDPDRITIRGHAAVFDRLSEDLGGFRERIARGAFRKALDQNDDVRLLINHESYPVLARTKSGTLELREDPRGLHVFADVAPTSSARDLRMSMQRGDIDQMSFGFTVAEGGDTWTMDGEQIVRTVTRVDQLFDVSIVTFPAYQQTSVDARSQDSPVTPDPDTEVPAEELDAEPSADLAEAGMDTEASGDAPTDDEPAVLRTRRSLAERIIQRVTER
jgi:HK97 family phage prohead protease